LSPGGKHAGGAELVDVPDIEEAAAVDLLQKTLDARQGASWHGRSQEWLLQQGEGFSKEKDSDGAFLAGQALNQNHATQFFSNKRVRFPTPCSPSC
jgi:hypothetical protein